ncbi:glycoside hydrolase family 3 N-terminal domain-containing protein [Carboxylicivirga sp. N1Y90]|uniref:glycoside hydrolase family 3 N-terminal domain-containing protein n=1 Tax=Carboxylicivirga fragile TaxID=3417571 RepID=UPI003D343078|nr:serine hydrolase [Marinilabiliaceae bacterium N1Y90]
MRYFAFILFLHSFLFIQAQNHSANHLFQVSPKTELWVDSVYASLNMEERIAQLFWIAIENSENLTQNYKYQKLIEQHQPGGIVIFKTNPQQLVSVNNHYQSLSKTPLMVAIDGEWGLGMRLDSILSFPYQMTLGAIANDSLIFEMGKEVGRQLSAMGIHVNFAPVVDVNNNADNPVIGKRSFGENPVKVANKALLYAQGMQSEGIIAVAKHFPGHGDTDVDSHKALPVIPYTKERLDSIELYPFRQLIDNGIMGVMTAHLNVPKLEPEPNKPSSTSKAIVTDLLKKEMHFKGLVITDAVNMRGLSNYDKPGVVDLKCLMAGNDVVEFTKDLPLAIQTVKAAIEEGNFNEAELEEKCKKVLAAKYWCGLSEYTPVRLNKAKLQNNKAQLLIRQLFAQSITVLENKDSILPFNKLESLDVTAVCFKNKAEWRDLLWRYTAIDLKGQEAINDLLLDTKSETIVLLLVEDLATIKKYQSQLDSLIDSRKCCLVYGGSPYDLTRLNNLSKTNALVLSYQNNANTRDLVTQMLFGAIPANGVLPVGINANYKEGMGIEVSALGRLHYTLPEASGLDSDWINNKVDSVVLAGLDMKAFPGCHVLVAYDRNVIFNKTYGFHTYERRKKVHQNDVFDLASVTKISGPLPLLMKAYEQGLIDLDQPFSEAWSDWKKGFLHPSNKSDISFREILAHQGRLTPYINYYPSTMKHGKYKSKYYSSSADETYNLKIDEHLYLNSKFKKQIYKSIRKSPLLDKKAYKYSGLSFMIYPEMLTELFETDYSELLYQTFFEPLGASSLCYNPLDRMSANRILPTEYDKYYRKKQIQGTVHDEAAAVMGGVSGNAGLFSSANDLAKLMQMYLQKGEYAGKRYLDEAVVEEFIRVQFPENNNRRALGFDKPLFGNDTLSIENSYPAPAVSITSFGHGGFTGTFVWLDPDKKLMYIFLSNRVYPTRENRLIYQKNIRPSIQQVFYDALAKRN